MKKIDTLISDVHEMVCNPEPTTAKHAAAAELGEDIAALFLSRLNGDQDEPSLERKVLRMSSAGHPCVRKLWYSFRPETPKAALTAATRIKFMFGDIIEMLVIAFARAAGHKISGKQTRRIIELPNGWKVIGHQDVEIDDELVDVKSAASRSMEKFRTNNFGDDAFGYVMQLSLYRDAAGKERAYWVALDKQHGHMVLTPLVSDPIRKDDLVHLTNTIEKDVEPPRYADGTKLLDNGNVELTAVCSYCDYKKHCYRDVNGGAGLRSFGYAGRVSHLAHVEKQPRVSEV